MKALVAGFLTTLCLSACGAPTTETSELAGDASPAASTEATTPSQDFIKVVATDTTLESVKLRRDHGRRVTDVTLGVMMGCLDRLADFGFDVERHGAKVLLRASAHVLVNKSSHLVRCARANYATRVVTLSGSVRKDQIELLSLEDLGETALEEGDLALRKLEAARVVSASMICPPNPSGMSCMAVGSRVELEVVLQGCADRLGPVASRFELGHDGKVDLYVKILDVATELSTRIDCFAATKVRVPLVTGFNVTRPGQVRVHVLH